MSSPCFASAAPVPVVMLGDILLVTLHGEVHDGTVGQLQQDVAQRIAHSTATGVVIDISGVDVVDSFLGRILADIASTARLSAARTVLAGMRPAVAITLVELGLAPPGLHTAPDVARARELLGRHASSGTSSDAEDGP